MRKKKGKTKAQTQTEKSLVCMLLVNWLNKWFTFCSQAEERRAGWEVCWGEIREENESWNYWKREQPELCCVCNANQFKFVLIWVLVITEASYWLETLSLVGWLWCLAQLSRVYCMHTQLICKLDAKHWYQTDSNMLFAATHR